MNFQNTAYNLWVAKEGGSVKVKISSLVNGSQKLIATVTYKDFSAQAQNNIIKLVADAKALADSSARKNPPKGALNELQALLARVAEDANGVKSDIRDGQCTALGACLSFGTLTCTNHGWLPVQSVLAGMKVLAQNENDRNAAPDWKLVEQTFIRTGRVIHLHLPNGQVIGTTREHPFFLEGHGWTPAGMLQPGDKISMLSREWISVSEIFDTGEYETVYNFRVVDWHTYFVGGEGCEVWAHNDYSWVKQTAGKFNFTTGSYVKVSNQPKTYSKDWWLPTGETTTPRDSRICKDNTQKIGDLLSTAAQGLADGWTKKDFTIRYGSRLSSTIEPLLVKINAFLSDGKQLSLDLIDKQGMRFPTLEATNNDYNALIKSFWFQRSVAIGAYVHLGLKDQFDGSMGLLYNGGKGPDFDLSLNSTTKVYFEVLPDTAASLEAHASRSMNKFVYRTVYYNRHLINNPGSQEPGCEDPALGIS